MHRIRYVLILAIATACSSETNIAVDDAGAIDAGAIDAGRFICQVRLSCGRAHRCMRRRYAFKGLLRNRYDVAVGRKHQMADACDETATYVFSRPAVMASHFLCSLRICRRIYCMTQRVDMLFGGKPARFVQFSTLHILKASQSFNRPRNGCWNLRAC